MNREDKYLFDSAKRNQKKKQKEDRKEISFEEQIQNLIIVGVVVHLVCQTIQELKEEKAKGGSE